MSAENDNEKAPGIHPDLRALFEGDQRPSQVFDKDTYVADNDPALTELNAYARVLIMAEKGQRSTRLSATEFFVQVMYIHWPTIQNALKIADGVTSAGTTVIKKSKSERTEEDLRTDFEDWMIKHLGKKKMSPYDMGVMAYRAGYRANKDAGTA